MAPLPPFMQRLNVEGIELTLDAKALDEFHRNEQEYREVLAHTHASIGHLLERYGQCPIWCHGCTSTHWHYGHECAARDGFDLGDPNRGMAWFGGMRYAGTAAGETGRPYAQEDSIFLVNLQKAVLGEHITPTDGAPAFWCGHPTVFIHELTHWCASRVGYQRMSPVDAAYERTVAQKAEILRRFTVHNRIQFDGHHLANAQELLAYAMEAIHSRPRSYSRYGIIFEAPTFPTTRAELRALDSELGTGIYDAIEEVFGLPPALGNPILEAAPGVAATKAAVRAVTHETDIGESSRNMPGEAQELEEMLARIHAEEAELAAKRRAVEARLRAAAERAAHAAGREQGWRDGFEAARKMVAPELDGDELLAAHLLSQDVE